MSEGNHLRRWSPRMSPRLSPSLRRRSPYTTLEATDTNSSNSPDQNGANHRSSTPLAEQMVSAQGHGSSPSSRSRFSFFPISKPSPRASDENDGESHKDSFAGSTRSPIKSPTKPPDLNPSLSTIFRTGSKIEVIDDTAYHYDEGKDKFTKKNVQSIPEVSIPEKKRDRNELHDVCENSTSIVELRRARTLLMESPSKNGQKVWNCASRTDHRGRTPLHLFSVNSALAVALDENSESYTDSREDLRLFRHASFDQDTFSEKSLIQFVVEDLLPAYPGAMMIQDIHGYIPFERLLHDWVESCNDSCNTLSYNRSSQYVNVKFSQVWESTSSTVLTAVKLAGRHMNKTSLTTLEEHSPEVVIDVDNCNNPQRDIPKPFDDDIHGSNDSCFKENEEDAFRANSFPSDVRLSANVRFALVMLSAIVDQLELYTSPKAHYNRRERRQKNVVYDLQEDAFDRARRELRTFRETYGSVEISTIVVQKIASIPDLMKTILLVDDEEDRQFALSTSIIRRVMLSKLSIGEWMTAMLQSQDRAISQKIVGYLKLVSETSKSVMPESSNSHSRIVRQGAQERDFTSCDEFINEVSRLKDFVPGLLCLGERGVEEASTTLVVQRVLDRMISRPFAITVVLCDLLFLALLIVGFRSAVNRLITGEPPAAVLKWIYVANTGVFYFIIREIGKMVSLCLIAKRARLYFLSFWNVIDLSATVLVLIATISMRYHFTFTEKGTDENWMLRGLLAVTTGFLWLRVLSLLKAINMQLATFVLAILQITRDILWFCVILLTMVVSFAQMFYTLLAPSSCASQGTNDIECSQTEFLLRTYTILLGDFGEFGRDHFNTQFSLFLVVFYSFLVTVILLNVLIAIASDSYEKCLVRSQNLFGRARVMLIAELVSFQYLLRKTDQREEREPTNVPIYSKKWWSSGPWNQDWSRGSVLFFALSSTSIAGWIIGEFIGFAKGEHHGDVLSSLASVIVNVVLYVAIMAFLARGAAGITAKKENSEDESQDGDESEAHSLWNDGFLQRAMLKLLGTSSTQKQMGDSFKTAEWNGRVDYLQREMTRIAEESAALLNERSRAMENLVSLSESRIRAEMCTMEGRFSVLENDVMSEIKGTKVTNALVTSAIDELKSLISAASSSSTSAFQSPVPSVLNINNTQFVRFNSKHA